MAIITCSFSLFKLLHKCVNAHLIVFSLAGFSIFQEAALDEMKKELQARPTAKLVDDLRKKVKILQVMKFLFPCCIAEILFSHCFCYLFCISFVIFCWYADQRIIVNLFLGALLGILIPFSYPFTFHSSPENVL